MKMYWKVFLALVVFLTWHFLLRAGLKIENDSNSRHNKKCKCQQNQQIGNKFISKCGMPQQKIVQSKCITKKISFFDHPAIRRQMGISDNITVLGGPEIIYQRKERTYTKSLIKFNQSMDDYEIIIEFLTPTEMNETKYSLESDYINAEFSYSKDDFDLIENNNNYFNFNFLVDNPPPGKKVQLVELEIDTNDEEDVEENDVQFPLIKNLLSNVFKTEDTSMSEDDFKELIESHLDSDVNFLLDKAIKNFSDFMEDKFNSASDEWKRNFKIFIQQYKTNIQSQIKGKNQDFRISVNIKGNDGENLKVHVINVKFNGTKCYVVPYPPEIDLNLIQNEYDIKDNDGSLDDNGTSINEDLGVETELKLFRKVERKQINEFNEIKENKTEEKENKLREKENNLNDMMILINDYLEEEKPSPLGKHMKRLLKVIIIIQVISMIIIYFKYK